MASATRTASPAQASIAGKTYQGGSLTPSAKRGKRYGAKGFGELGPAGKGSPRRARAAASAATRLGKTQQPVNDAEGVSY